MRSFWLPGGSAAGGRRRLVAFLIIICTPPRPLSAHDCTVQSNCFFLPASAALRSAGGDLEKAKYIVASSRKPANKMSKVATKSKSRDLDVSMSLKDQGTPPKHPRKVSDKKRYRGDRLVDQRTKLGRIAMHDMDKLSARELAARAAVERFGGGDNSRSPADLPTVKKKPAVGDKQKPTKPKKQLKLGFSKRKYEPVLTKNNPRREVSLPRRYTNIIVFLSLSARATHSGTRTWKNQI